MIILILILLIIILINKININIYKSVMVPYEKNGLHVKENEKKEKKTKRIWRKFFRAYFLSNDYEIIIECEPRRLKRRERMSAGQTKINKSSILSL